MRPIRSIASVLCLVASLNTQASGSPEDTQQLRDLLQPISSLSAQFEQQIIDANGFELQTSAGLFQVSQPNNLRWIVNQPMPQHVISDGVTLWLYDPDLEQVVIQPFNTDIASTPAMLFSGDLDQIDNAYSILRAADGVFKLSPKEPGSLFGELTIEFDGKVPVSIGLTDSLGQITQIKFAEVSYNPVIPADLFAFKVPADVDVIRND